MDFCSYFIYCFIYFYYFFFFFFFFQAEDGIRDLYVTGVQTCALPICDRHHLEHRGVTPADRDDADRGARPVAALHVELGRRHRARRRVELPHQRSEERRVGKECRSGWAPDHCRKKRDELNNSWSVVRS